MAKANKLVGGMFSFDSALLILKAGGRVTRRAWGGHGNWVKEDQQRFIRSTSDGKSSPYLPDYADLFAGDWMAEHIADVV